MGNNLQLIDSGFALAIGTELINNMVEFATMSLPEGYEAKDMNIAFSFKSDNPVIPACLHGDWTINIRKGDIDGHSSTD